MDLPQGPLQVQGHVTQKLGQISTTAQLSQRKPTVAFVCYWQTDDIHTFCDLGWLYVRNEAR